MAHGISIGTRLMTYVVSLLALVAVVGTTALLTLSKVEQTATSVDSRWLAATRLLDRLSDEVTQFRLAEIERALARTSASAAPESDVDDAMASAHRTSVDRLATEFETLVDVDRTRVDPAEFISAWTDYLVVHDAWLRADVYRHAGGLARAKSSLDWRYKAVDAGLGRLKAASYVAASSEVDAAVASAVKLERIVVTSFVIASLLALLVLADVKRGIVGPLRSMTRALSRLAAGEFGFSIPELHRKDEIGRMAKAFDVFRANAEELEAAHARTREAQAQAHSLARQDALTGLPNRRMFAAELEASLDRARQESCSCALLLVDLDGFKPINDVHGHGVGDRVLCEVARRLEDVPGPNKTVARLGSDEFAIIIEPSAQAVALVAAETAEQVLAALRRPFRFEDLQVELAASVGIACWPAGDSAADMVHGADLAMYRSKQGGRDRFCFFEPSMGKDWRDQITLDEDLRGAVLARHIEPHYQPLVDLATGEIRGFEVLARWNHPEHGAIPPDRFIAMAERLDLMSGLTSGVLRQACRDAFDWGDGVSLAVNVSPCQIIDLSFPQDVLAILRDEGFPASRLEIEVTESALIRDIDAAKAVLSCLQESGIRVSLDDFGTGYSSLYHLRNLKFDKIKIDRSFVQSMHSNLESAKIVDAVLGLARSLGMSVVAEGIEDEAASTHLTDRGCEYGQGFFYGRPVRAADAVSLLAIELERSSLRLGPALLQQRLRTEFEGSPTAEQGPPAIKAVA